VIPALPGRAAARKAVRAAIPLLAAAMAGCGGGGTPTSAVLISVDNLSPDRLGCYGCPHARTPLWDRLGRRGAVFLTALSSSPRTLPASATLLSGVHPFTHGARRDGDRSFAPPGLTLAEALAHAGLRCGAVTASDAFDAGTDIARGFEHFGGAESPGQRERTARSACESALRWVAGLPPEDGFFLFLHLNDPAPPHRAGEPWRSLFADPYDAEIAAADHALTELFLDLGVMGRLERAVVAATSSHGPGPPDALSDSSLRVPLVVWGPLPFRGGQLRRDPALLVDVLPTVLAAFRIGPDWRLPGRSLDSGEPDDPVEAYAEVAGGGGEPVSSLRVGGWKLIDSEPPKLFHVAGDPGEQENLAAAEPSRVDSLRARLNAMTTHVPHP
jgi:arylsulfatase A-like enzyme